MLHYRRTEEVSEVSSCGPLAAAGPRRLVEERMGGLRYRLGDGGDGLKGETVGW